MAGRHLEIPSLTFAQRVQGLQKRIKRLASICGAFGKSLFARISLLLMRSLMPIRVCQFDCTAHDRRLINRRAFKARSAILRAHIATTTTIIMINGNKQRNYPLDSEIAQSS